MALAAGDRREQFSGASGSSVSCFIDATNGDESPSCVRCQFGRMLPVERGPSGECFGFDHPDPRVCAGLTGNCRFAVPTQRRFGVTKSGFVAGTVVQGGSLWPGGTGLQEVLGRVGEFSASGRNGMRELSV